MISEMMLYGTKVVLLVSLGALALERVAAWRGIPRRGIWIAALVLALAMPAVRMVMPRPALSGRAAAVASSYPLVAKPSGPAQEVRAAATAEMSAIASEADQRRLAWPARPSPERLLLTVWLSASCSLVSFYAVVWLRLRRAARHWRRERVDGQVVRVTEALGPAVYGVFQPVILIPQWVLGAPSQMRRLILAHELEHIAARDSTLTVLGLALVVVTPWNPFVWWQLQRLRLSIEVDCDARVLRRGEEATAYGEVLLAVGQRRSWMPLGAIALIEPASQLLQRIRIMTADLPKRGKWAMSLAVGLSLASLAVAAQLAAPALRVDSSSHERAGEAQQLATLEPLALHAKAALDTAELRKPPLGEDTRLAHVQSLVRATYPELFGASAPSGPVLVTLLLNGDGTLYKSFKEGIEPRPWITTSFKAFDVMGVDYQDLGAGLKVRMNGSPGARNPIDVHAWYLQPPGDPARDVAIVRAQVKARYANLFAPRYADGSRVITEDAKLLTVFMTASGEIERAKVEEAQGVDRTIPATVEHFVAMGIAKEHIGPIGTTELYAGHFIDDRDLKMLRVIYAWPRRPGEPDGVRTPAPQPGGGGTNDDPAVDRAIAEHYFPDLYTYPKEWPRADPWVLLDGQGRVLKTGRRVVMSTRDIQLYVESLYPGIRTDKVQVTTIHGNAGQWADIGFVWLAADSPITDPSQSDLSRRNALLLYADVVGEGMTRPTELVALKVGSSAVAVCSLKNPFGVVHLQVTAVEMGTDAVTVRVQVQHAPLQATAEPLPEAVQAEWPPESNSVRAPYDLSTAVDVTDQNGKAWKIVLHPERLGAAAS